MKITVATTFLDGRERFEAGETLSTEAGQGARVITKAQYDRFVAAGWTEKPQDQPAADLEVQNLVHPQGVSHG